MSDPKTMYDNGVDLDSILLPPLKKHAIKYTFKGWKSLALLHSWDDLKIFNTDFDAMYKYEKFKIDYKYIIKNEKKLLQKIDDYKIAKAKSIKKKSSKISLKKSKTAKKTSKSIKTPKINKKPVNNKMNSHNHLDYNQQFMPNMNNINNANANANAVYYNHNNYYAPVPYHNHSYPYNYNPYLNQTIAPQMPLIYYNKHNEYAYYNNHNHNEYEYGEITEMD
eukprot:UN02287